MRKQVLQPEQAEVLKSRVFIAKHTKIISMKNIEETYELSSITVRRYTDSHYREMARQDSIRQHQRELAHKNKGMCATCSKSLQGHARCTECTSLLHNNGSKCAFCEKRGLRKVIKPKRELGSAVTVFDIGVNYDQDRYPSKFEDSKRKIRYEKINGIHS